MPSATQIDLAALQGEALREGRDPMIGALQERGAPVLGVGSSRIALGLADGSVAKIAHTVAGLVMNLQEMAAWLAFRECRDSLTPCLDLTSELVLTQARAEVIGPPLVNAEDVEDPRWLSEHENAKVEYADAIYACRGELGLESDRDLTALRPDNFGLYEGRVVAIDYGDQFRPLPEVWAFLLGEPQPTMGDLVERAGLVVDEDRYVFLLQAVSPVLVEDFLDNLLDSNATALVASD